MVVIMKLHHLKKQNYKRYCFSCSCVLKPNLYTNVANFGLYNKTWNYYLNLNPFLKARKSITTSHLKTIEFSSPKDARWWDLGSQMFIMDISKSVNLKWPQKRTLVFCEETYRLRKKTTAWANYDWCSVLFLFIWELIKRSVTWTILMFLKMFTSLFVQNFHNHIHNVLKIAKRSLILVAIYMQKFKKLEKKNNFGIKIRKIKKAKILFLASKFKVQTVWLLLHG